jgi:hypothetical protein
MKTTTVAVDYGDRQIDIDVPGRVTVARFQEPERLRNPAASVRKALAEPHGAPPLADLIKPGMTVAIGFDDPTRPPAPWQVMLPEVVDALIQGGIKKKNIQLICAGGAHRKYTPAELAAFVGPKIFNMFWPSGQLTCHDCHDPAGLKDLGVTKGGGVAVHNRRFVESDLMIYCGQVMAHNWGGYTGMGVVVGLAGTRSINSHHSHKVVDDPKSANGDHMTMLYRRVKAEIQGQIEKATGNRIFYVNWVGGAKGRMAGVFAGYSPEVEPPAWKLADTFHKVKVPEADILVLGLPQKFAYGTVDDPLVAMVGLTTPPRTWLNKPILKEGGVVIGVAPSSGTVNTDTHPSYPETIDLYSRYHNIRDLADHEGVVGNRPEHLHQYTHGHAYHPIHGFWLFYESDYVFKRASAVIMAGTSNPGAFRAIGITPAQDFDQAWALARRNVGANPTTVVVPSYWSQRIFKFDVR